MKRAPLISRCVRHRLARVVIAAAVIACAPALFGQESVQGSRETAEERRDWYGDRVHVFLNDLRIPADVVLHLHTGGKRVTLQPGRLRAVADPHLLARLRQLLGNEHVRVVGGAPPPVVERQRFKPRQRTDEPVGAA